MTDPFACADLRLRLTDLTDPLFGLPKKPVFDFRAHFCHSAPMETHACGFRLRANAPEGQKRFPISSAQAPRPLSFGEGRRRRRALLPLLRSPRLARLCSNLYAEEARTFFGPIRAFLVEANEPETLLTFTVSQTAAQQVVVSAPVAPETVLSNPS
jgi:hypothetical protein